MSKKSDVFEKTLELHKSNSKELKSRLIVVENKITNMLTVFKIIQIFLVLLIILIIAYCIFTYYLNNYTPLLCCG
jgi:uncharacterized membrane protein YukC